MNTFHFKHFSIQQSNSILKVGTDAMILGAIVESNLRYKQILDIGTGTGVLALMTKQKNIQAKVTAIDIDAATLLDCNINFGNSPWKSDLKIIHSDITQYNPDFQFDCIICNPPYYEKGYLSASTKINQAKHTNEIFLEQLFNKVKNILSSNGHFWVILPYTTANKWQDYCTEKQLFTTEKTVIFGKSNHPIRIILKMELAKRNIIEKSILIRNENNQYSEEYKALTKEYHNKTL